MKEKQLATSMKQRRHLKYCNYKEMKFKTQTISSITKGKFRKSFHFSQNSISAILKRKKSAGKAGQGREKVEGSTHSLHKAD